MLQHTVVATDKPFLVFGYGGGGGGAVRDKTVCRAY